MTDTTKFVMGIITVCNRDNTEGISSGSDHSIVGRKMRPCPLCNSSDHYLLHVQSAERPMERDKRPIRGDAWMSAPLPLGSESVRQRAKIVATLHV